MTKRLDRHANTARGQRELIDYESKMKAELVNSERRGNSKPQAVEACSLTASIEELENQVAKLRAIFSDLYDRLQPLLLDEGPQEVGGCDVGNRSSAALVGRVEMITESVGDLQHGIIKTIHRLAI